MPASALTQLFTYYYEDHGVPRDLFLLHGTGADEYDLPPLVKPLASKYNFVSLRGNVSEGGMLRFFRRLGMGKFDQESIKEETTKLSQFIQEWCKNHDRQLNDLSFLGYSNGANMILATAFYYSQLINYAALLHPMLPFKPEPELNLEGKRFLVTYGQHDMMVSAKESRKVIKTLRERRAAVSVYQHPGGHEITGEEMEMCLSFYCESFQF